MRATILQSGILRTSVRPRPAPSLFSFPGLRGMPYWPQSAFESHAAVLRANYDTILEEYLRVEKRKASDYAGEEHKLHDGKWDWHSYLLKGKRQADFAAHCPRTADILESFEQPRLMVGTPFSFAFFSTLHPHSKISAHSAPCNLRVRCHFPLIVPQNATVNDCGMRIGDEAFQWKTGEPVFFDDAYDHEVWNNTDQTRVVLLLDLWHPDLHGDEIEAIQDMFEDARKKGWLK